MQWLVACSKGQVYMNYTPAEETGEARLGCGGPHTKGHASAYFAGSVLADMWGPGARFMGGSHQLSHEA